MNLDQDHVNPVVSFRSDEEQMPALFRIRHDRTRSQEDVSEVEVATHPQTPQSSFCTWQMLRLMD